MVYLGRITGETNVFSVEIVKFIKVRSRRGTGKENDPVMVITEYYDFDGRLLFRAPFSVPEIPPEVE